MNIWRAVHREVRSAWRSLHYDLRKPAGAAGETAQLPRVDADEQHPAYDAYARRTRRVRTAVVVAALAVGGAAATYFGVVGGLAALLASETGPPEALPGVSAEDTRGAPDAAIGGAGKAARPAAEAASETPEHQHPALSEESGTAGEPNRPSLTIRPPRRTVDPDPPVPTPAPHPTPTCSESPDPEPTPSPSPSSHSSPPPAPPE